MFFSVLTWKTALWSSRTCSSISTNWDTASWKVKSWGDTSSSWRTHPPGQTGTHAVSTWNTLLIMSVLYLKWWHMFFLPTGLTLCFGSHNPVHLHSAHRAVLSRLSVARYSASPRPKDPADWQRGCWVAPPPSLGWDPLSAPSPCREKTMSRSGPRLSQQTCSEHGCCVIWRWVALTVGSKAFTNSTGW